MPGWNTDQEKLRRKKLFASFITRFETRSDSSMVNFWEAPTAVTLLEIVWNGVEAQDGYDGWRGVPLRRGPTQSNEGLATTMALVVMAPVSLKWLWCERQRLSVEVHCGGHHVVCSYKKEEKEWCEPTARAQRWVTCGEHKPPQLC